MGNMQYSAIKKDDDKCQNDDQTTDEEKALFKRINNSPFICISNDRKKIIIVIPFVTNHNSAYVVIKEYDIDTCSNEEAIIISKEALDFVDNKVIPKIKQLFNFDN
jgi:choline-glycine betaine transporter